MREREAPVPFPLRGGDVRETHSLSDWEAAVNRRNGVYAAALCRALEEGKSPDEARVIARQAFLQSFEQTPETEFAVSLAGTEVAPTPKRGRRAA